MSQLVRDQVTHQWVAAAAFADGSESPTQQGSKW